MNGYPIYVISKGRSSSCLTSRELSSMGVDHYLVCEPDEAVLYQKNYPNAKLIITPFRNLGLGSIPVRNFVWDHSIEIGAARHWVLDDNIEGFHRLHKNTKYKILDRTPFNCIENFVDRYDNVPISGMNYYSFCKATDKVPAFYKNTRVYSCILLDNSLPIRWRGRFNEDTDLCLRVLKMGMCTVLFNSFLCGKVTTMRMRGGNTDSIYNDTDNRKEFAESLVNQHPDVAKVTWKFNRWHHQVDYSSFKKNKLIKKSDYNEIVSRLKFNLQLNS